MIILLWGWASGNGCPKFFYKFFPNVKNPIIFAQPNHNNMKLGILEQLTAWFPYIIGAGLIICLVCAAAWFIEREINSDDEQ